MKIGVTGLDVIAGQGFLIVGPLGEGRLKIGVTGLDAPLRKPSACRRVRPNTSA